MPVGDTGRGPGQGAQQQIPKHAFSGAIFVLGMPFLRAFYTVYDVEAKAVCLVAECRSELDKAKRMGIARAKHKSKQALLHVVSCRCSTRLRRTQNAQVIADAGAQVKLVSLRPAGTDLQGKAWTQSKIQSQPCVGRKTICSSKHKDPQATSRMSNDGKDGSK